MNMMKKQTKMYPERLNKDVNLCQVPELDKVPTFL